MRNTHNPSNRDIARRALIITVCTVLVCGCGGAPHSVKPSDVKSQKAKPEPPQVIDTKGGETTYLGTKNEKLWTVHWAAGVLTFARSEGKERKSGQMTDVYGDIYKNDKIACRFKSKHGDADSSSQKLILTEQVRIDAENPKATLLCDRLTYDGNRKFLKAFGHVQVLGTMGTRGTLDEVWATPDLAKIATPSMFDKP